MLKHMNLTMNIYKLNILNKMLSFQKKMLFMILYHKNLKLTNPTLKNPHMIKFI